MQHVTGRPSLARRFLGATALSFLATLLLSGSASAVYYNLGMFWKTQTPVATFTERRIAEGDSHSCAVVSDGTVKCWGLNTDGQLGDGTTTQRNTPVTVSGLTDAVSIALGLGHSCAVLSNGTVKCWGRNNYGQIGDGTTTQRNTPVAVSGLTGAVSLAEGSYHSCAVLSDGSAKCWGWNADGQLGDGTNTNRTTPVAVTGLSGAVAMTAGRYAHTCALLSDGTARCWGMGAWGQLGNNTTSNSWTPVVVSGITGAVSITGGIRHNCVQLSDGSAKCWGYNDVGQLGDGTTTNRLTAVAVSGLSGAVAISCGGWGSSCAALSDGTAKCWGLNSSGQLGDGTVTSRSTPVTVSGLSGVVSTATGTAQSCAALSDGTLKCWGSNANGQLGDGTTNNRTTPNPVTGSTTGGPWLTFKDALSVAVGDFHSCALLTHGTVKCWGNGFYGQLGNGLNTNTQPNPVSVTGLSDAIAVDEGAYFSCALLSNGTAKCWGRNNYGQLGNGTTTDTNSPVTVTGLSGAAAISIYESRGCALLSSGGVKCWGAGPLGNGTTGSSSIPVTVSGLTDAVSVAAGFSHNCAIVSDGTVKCWGTNAYGALGDGTTVDKLTPVAVSGLNGVVSLGSGYYHNCAILSDGTAKCWGYGVSGQLGNGAVTDSLTPVAVSGLTNAISISAGAFGDYALLSDGTVKSWGANVWGQLGDGTTSNRNTPVTVSGLSNVISIGLGGSHGCAALSDGTAKCLGRNDFGGELGDGTMANSLQPVAVTLDPHIYSSGVQTANNANTSLTITKPGRTATDTVMVAAITTRPSTTAITTPSGWTLLQSQATGNVRQSTYYRVATAADDSVPQYTWILSVSSKVSGVIVGYGGVDPAAPIISSDGLATGASATITAPTLTTTETEFHSVTFHGIASSNTITGPAGYSFVGGDVTSGGGGATTQVSTLVSEKRYTAAGATGAITATVTAVDNVGQHLLLKKAP